MARVTEAARLDWNIGELIEKNELNEIDFSVPIQRGYVWDNKRNSLLIHSILIGLPISVFYFNKVGNIYEGLEGKQRNNAIYNFVKNNYKLHSATPVVEYRDKEYKLARCTFSDLPKMLQNKILRYGLIVQCFDKLTEDEKILIFTRINSGKPVTPAEIARIKVKSQKTFMELVEHDAIKFGVSDKNKEKYVDVDIVEDIWCITYNENPSLLNKYRSVLLATTEVLPKQKAEMQNGFDYLLELLRFAQRDKKIFSKIRAKTHLVSLGYMSILASRQGIEITEYIEKVLNFFNGEGTATTISDAYNNAVRSGSAKAEQVMIRKRELENLLIK